MRFTVDFRVLGEEKTWWVFVNVRNCKTRRLVSINHAKTRRLAGIMGEKNEKKRRVTPRALLARERRRIAKIAELSRYPNRARVT